MKSLRTQRSHIAQQLLYIERIKRLRTKFSTIEGYIYCIADESRYKRELTRINLEMEVVR